MTEDSDPMRWYDRAERERRIFASQDEWRREQRSRRIGRALIGWYLVFGSVVLVYLGWHFASWAVR